METYSQIRVIGEGSFGRAVLVQCRNTQEKYVLKEIQLPKNQSKLQSSRREAVLLSRMKHPNIVAFREAFEGDGLLCIVMEYCGGGDLLQRIQQQQKSSQFTVENILKWFAQMCAGAKHIHDKRVLHRDLKSKNIFLTDDSSVKLGDFGSACVLNSSKAYAQAYVGTPYYVAPEIWDNKPYNNKSDVWSLGCVLYELCTLQHPFQASSWKSLILKVCRGAYPPLPNHLPYELHYLIKHMFKTNPKDRPSVRTILTSHRVSRLLRSHLPPQASEEEGEKRRTGRWKKEEGRKVANFLGEKSLIKTSTIEGLGEDVPKSCCESSEPGCRKQWTAESPSAVLQMLANASLASSDSMAAACQTGSTRESDSEAGRQRKQWVREAPERLLGLLEKAQLNKAFSTFLIHRGDDNPLVGPLSRHRGDDTDGPELEVADEYRLQPRSDDEDTDFEEESPCDWVDEVEKIFSEH
ncbi:PREDICTED: serine/threonine-protein kinase Nek3 isoform X1 [Poecilia mexicana]|uniref:Protein kinase domain-containing protein n=2 Tax=Poecilia mexicana TaxID=48701 RepID=A0A3B3WYC7_9TELE|nr:PREDICTED: serine/threonine-protein kinase Nek3 isoform X1 [Poecilia mexicana]XP_014836695.1 PREDICTED: serine/threonine-protein kinase Nek3 isoform X1 [Poecilia mexicana]XP_014836703.1 PREDICTED: serine/threonine-protein kinase Nek3 isoform X1 [Poecilia mexicana]